MNSATGDRKLLCTDLDGTFLGDDESMYQLVRLIDTRHILLVFSSGRHLQSIMEMERDKGIRHADAYICMVGTAIYFVSEGEPAKDAEWSRIISRGWDIAHVREIAARFNELVPQDDEWQSEFKASFHLTRNRDWAIPELRRRLREAGIQATVIYSGGQFLDIIPTAAGKADAVFYVARRFGIPPGNIVVAGDSGNDLDMFKAGLKGIIVGGARPGLASFEGANAYEAEGHCAAGIIEGLRHHGLIGPGDVVGLSLP